MADIMYDAGRYILDSHGNPVPCPDLIEWATYMETMNRRIALAKVYGVRVSTVFLGLNQNWLGEPPILFETMVFGGKYDSLQKRYHTKFEAEMGHIKIVEMVRDRWLISLLIEGLWIKLKKAKEYIQVYAEKKGIYTPRWRKQLKEYSNSLSTNGETLTKVEKK
jgi:hypothetical protein